MKQFSNYSITSTDEDNTDYSNVMFEIPDFSLYKSDFRIYTITAKTEFRPDKIAKLVYEDDLLSWVIDETNGLNKMSEYTRGKDIFYLPYYIISTLLGV